MKEVTLGIEDPEAKVLIGSLMPEQIEKDLLIYLITRSNTFTWKQDDMKSLDKIIITHKLNLNPSFRPIHQKKRMLSPKRN